MACGGLGVSQREVGRVAAYEVGRVAASKLKEEKHPREGRIVVK